MGLISNGTTIFDAGALDSGLAKGSMTLIKNITLSSAAASISFVDGASGVVLDDTYKEYIFFFNNIHPATDSANLQFQASINTGSGYGVAITSTYFQAQHAEDNSEVALEYDGGQDLAQGTGFQTILGKEPGNGNDESTSGFMHLFDPSNTTSMKHFEGNFQSIAHSNRSNNQYVQGYINTTTAITRVRFKFSGGNIDTGTIKMYGIV